MVVYFQNVRLSEAFKKIMTFLPVRNIRRSQNSAYGQYTSRKRRGRLFRGGLRIGTGIKFI